jgi:CubicO group peptidase (beta-lactamase class C family)
MRFGGIVIIAIGLFVSFPSLAADVSQQQVDQIFAAYNKPSSPGCALGVIRDGNFVYRKGYGMGSLEFGVPLSSQSVFYMGSVSKQFTAASVVLAAEQGFLSLDDTIRKYIPELPDYGEPITLRQLLHHTSGLPDYLALIYISGRNAEDLHPTAESIDLVARQKVLNFKPGAEYQYSNTNYLLLGEVVKRATKKSLSVFAAENIFRPLGMSHTRFYDDHTVVVPGRVSAYRPGDNGNFLVDWSTNYENVGGGGVMTTVDDLLLWDRNFYENKIGNRTFLKEMQTRGSLADGSSSDYALGLSLKSYRGLPIVGHDGGMFGYRTYLFRFPDQRFSVICLCNVESADPESLSRKVADIYLEKQLEKPRKAVAPGNDVSVVEGRYFDSRMHFPVSFPLEHGNLMLQGHVLEPIGPNAFEDPIVGGTVTFSGSGQAMKATTVYNHAVTFTGAKIENLHLDDATLSTYAGIYRNTELDATYKLSVESGNLTLRMNWNSVIKLEPVVQNEFSGGGITLVFRKDGRGRVSGLSVFAGWDGVIRNMKFEKTH